MLDEAKKELINIFANRVAFHKIECMVYSSDLATLPGIINKQIATQPDAVVQPKSNDELLALLDLAMKYGIPLTPRGSGTAGYGGAVPTRGGIVVDFSRMNRILDINKDNSTTTVEPGVIWNDLEIKLRSHGLALRLYPSSAISSTVAGLLANGGGVGIGSFEYGYLKNNIVEAEVLTTKGLRRFTTINLDLIEGMAGTNGFISKIKLLVRDSDREVPVVAVFHSLSELVNTCKELRESELALWEVSFKDKLYVQLTEEATENNSHHATLHHSVKRLKLPEDKFIAMFVYPEIRTADIKNRLLSIINSRGGELVGEDLSRFVWDERFYPMRLKAIGPSIVPSEVVIPFEKLLMFIDLMQSKIKRAGFHGTLVNKGVEATVFSFILDNEHRRGYPLLFSTSLLPIQIAERLGGRPYAIGMFLTSDAELCFGKESLQNAYKLKQKVDASHIMNPGKIFPASLDKDSPTKRINLLSKIARNHTALIEFADKLFGGNPPKEMIDRKSTLSKLPFGKEIAWDAFACTNCGNCRTICPEFKAIGWETASPRGKFHILREYLNGKISLDERIAEMFFACTTCRRCDFVCQAGIPIEDHWGLTMRPAIWREGFNPPLIYQVQAHNILSVHNPGGNPQSQRTAWLTLDTKHQEEGDIGYWAGCNVSFSYNFRNLAVNALRILNRAGIEPVYLGCDEWCCGGTLYTVGCHDEAMETIEHNIKEIIRRSIKKLIVSCSGCWLNLSHYYPFFAKRLGLEFPVKIVHITEAISELIQDNHIKCEKPVNLKVTYHDPCHIGRGGGIFEPPRKILFSIPGLELLEMQHIRENSSCCGRHTLRYPQLGKIINESRLTEAEQTGAVALVTACPTCESNFRIGVTGKGTKIEVLDITDLVAWSAGLPILSISKLPKLLRKNA